MKFLEKLGLAIFSIIVLVISIILCLIAFGWMESTIFSILIGKVLISQTYTYIMVGVCIFLILLAIRCIFFSDPKEEDDEVIDESENGILLQNEDGRLLITVETLKNMVEGVINDFSNITDSACGVTITKENDIIINVSIDVTKDTIIKDISSKLQIRIKKSIKEATGLELQAVNVRVRNAEAVMSYAEKDEKSVPVENVDEIKEVKNEAPKKSVSQKAVKQTKTVKKNPAKSTKKSTTAKKSK